MAECTVRAFRDTMVNWYKDKAVGWVGEGRYSPILDVTNTVRKISPGVKKAYLTIYGDDLAKIKVVEPGIKGRLLLYPDGRPADRETFGDKVIINRIYNWLAGYEFERETCEKDGKQYWVIYPCEFHFSGTLQLPCTKETFKGKQDEVVDVTDIVRQYFPEDKIYWARLKIYKTRPIAVIGVYEGKPDRYADGRPADRGKYGRDAIKNIVENWFRGQEWERQEWPRNSGKWYWVIYPCELEFDGERSKKGKKELRVTINPPQPKPGQTVKVKWSYKSTWNKTFKFEFDFILHKPNGTSERVHNESRHIRPGQTVSGEFTFPMPKDLPGKYVFEAVDYVWHEGKRDDEDRVRIEWTIPGAGEPTVYDFVNSLVSKYKSKTPVLDVSGKLEHRLPDDPEHSPPCEYLDRRLLGIEMTYMDNYYGGDAKLKLYLDKPEEIEVIEYGYDKPPKRYTWAGDFVDNIVYGWLKGYEMERMYSQKSGKWYWIKIPAEFSYRIRRLEPILRVNRDGTVTYGFENHTHRYIDYITLFLDGEKLDRIGEIPPDEWRRRDWKITKTVRLPHLDTGYHVLTLVIHDDPDDDGFAAISKQFYVIELPYARIIKDLSKYGIFYNGRALEPGKGHQIPKGSKIEYFAMAQNVGGPGNIWIRLLVNGVEADRAEGGSPAIRGTITVDRDMTIKFEAGHGDVKDDEWGC